MRRGETVSRNQNIGIMDAVRCQSVQNLFDYPVYMMCQDMSIHELSYNTSTYSACAVINEVNVNRRSKC